MVRALLVGLVLVAMSGANAARAQDARPRAIWLECKTPAVWPAPAGTTLRLSCRVEGAARGPAFWQTVNPFRPDLSNDLLNPFEGLPRTLELFDVSPRRGRAALPPPPAAIPLADELMSPFEVIPESSEGAETLNPFEPRREDTRRPAR